MSGGGTALLRTVYISVCTVLVLSAHVIMLYEATSTDRSEGAHREVVERPVPFIDVLITPQLNGHSCRERRDTIHK